jgi:hydrogenase maturation factor
VTVNLVMLPEARVGDHVITHSGYAIRIFEPSASNDDATLMHD